MKKLLASIDEIFSKLDPDRSGTVRGRIRVSDRVRVSVRVRVKVRVGLQRHSEACP